MNPIVKNNNKLRWKFDNVSNLTDTGMFSDKFSIDDIEWKLRISTGTESAKQWFGAYLCNVSDKENEKNWICEIDTKYKVLSQSVDGKNVVNVAKICLKKDVEGWGYSDMVEWEKLISAENGYLKDDSIVIEVDFDFKYYDFSKKVPNFTDIIVNVDETDFHLNKGVLCSNSEYFYYLLVNKKVEDTVIKLDDVKAAELCYILVSFNPFFNGVVKENFEEIFEVAKKYRVSTLHHACEQFLLTDPKIELIQKFKYADENGYEMLMKSCIEKLKSGSDIKLLHANVKFSELKETTKLRIMQRLLEFH